MVDAVAADDVDEAAAAADDEDSRKTDNQLPDWDEDLGDESSDGNPDVAHRYDLMEHRN